ncbi:MAG: DUF134 domain-containing protein [Planctomycetota bacterium]
MSRPTCCRLVANAPGCTFFKPRGVPLCELEVVTLGLDELEALRLADLEGLYQEEAATKMKVSRPTFARIIETARRKAAEALVKGKALKLEGGNVILHGSRRFRCAACQHTWGGQHGKGRPAACPKCESRNLRRAETDCGCARQRGMGRGRQGHGCCGRQGRGRPSGASTADKSKIVESTTSQERSKA